MEAELRSSINKLTIVVGSVIAIQGIGLNFLISLIISLIILLVAFSLIGQPIREAFNSGKLTKQDLQKLIISSPYLWVGVVCCILLMIIM